MIKKRIMILLLVFVLWVTTGGFSIFRSDVMIDTEKTANRLYLYVTMDTLNADFAYSRSAAEQKYLGGYFMLVGEIYSRTTKGDSITLQGLTTPGTFDCTVSDRNVRTAVTSFSRGSKVALYGKVTLGVFDKEYHFAVEHVSAAPVNPRGGDVYYMTDGTSYSTLDGVERQLADGRIKYRIPDKFAEVELSIKDHALGNIEGYQYVLDRMDDGRSTEPESLFVCYFDRKMLKDRSDIRRPEDVARAIVMNIEGDASRSATKKVDTYYGARYIYFQGKYTTLFDGRGFHTEYVFKEDGENGLVVFLYLYRETERDRNRLSDVMFITRFLE